MASPAKKSTAAAADLVVDVTRPPIELNQFLKLAGFGESGGALKEQIKNGEVTLNGAVEMRRGKKLAHGDRVTLDGKTAVVNVV